MTKALIPLDGTENSYRAMEGAIGTLGADLDATLLVVKHGGFENAPEDRVEPFERDDDDEIFPSNDSCQRVLEEALQRAQALGAKPKTQVLEGRPHKVIIEQSAEYDLLVMHGLDKGAFLEKIRMSRTEGIARQASCSVLLVRSESS